MQARGWSAAARRAGRNVPFSIIDLYPDTSCENNPVVAGIGFSVAVKTGCETTFVGIYNHRIEETRYGTF